MRRPAPHVLRSVAGWLTKALVYAVGIVLSLWVLAPLYVITLAAFSSEEDV